jgi:hypothetical protein
VSWKVETIRSEANDVKKKTKINLCVVGEWRVESGSAAVRQELNHCGEWRVENDD